MSNVENVVRGDRGDLRPWNGGRVCSGTRTAAGLYGETSGRAHPWSVLGMWRRVWCSVARHPGSRTRKPFSAGSDTVSKTVRRRFGVSRVRIPPPPL
jgi:hypothetical protein